MIYYVDIDETICSYGDKREYSLAEPVKENINKINNLYDKGHKIVYWTARGSTTGIDWTDLTVKQLDKWGAKYHEVKLGKPHYDVFIDDKAINSEVFFKK
tara:strand:+ start:247 stop:546 length:300 start_codon:yes stop_codon:yes gene_type:complete